MLRRVTAGGLARTTQTLPAPTHAPIFRDIVRTLYISSNSRNATPIGSITPSLNSAVLIRTYATATVEATKPRRTRTKKPAAAEETVTPKTVRTRKVAPKKSVAPKKKKKKVTPKKKPAAKKRVAKALTPTQVRIVKLKDLRSKALLAPPKPLPASAWLVFVTEQVVKGSSATSQMTEVSTKFRAFSTSEREHYDKVAEQNRVANSKAHQTWVEKHTPDEIRIANNARRQLNKIAKEPLPADRKKRLVGVSPLIQDLRAVKRVDSPFIAFTRERWASGDFKDARPTEVMKVLGEEWRLVETSDKQRYIDAFKLNREQYLKDYDAIFTRGVKSPPRTPIAAAA